MDGLCGHCEFCVAMRGFAEVGDKDRLRVFWRDVNGGRKVLPQSLECFDVLRDALGLGAFQSRIVELRLGGFPLLGSEDDRGRVGNLMDPAYVSQGRKYYKDGERYFA